MDSIIIFCAKYLIVFVGIIWVWAWYGLSSKNQRKIIIQTILAGIIGIILLKIADKLYYDPRPFVKSNVKPLFAHGPDNGFPSDHTTLAMTLTSVIYFYNRRLAAVAAAMALLIGVARVLAHVHSPIDIIGGIAIGLFAGWSSRRLINRYWPKIKIKSSEINNS